jgi:hypothetical protein
MTELAPCAVNGPSETATGGWFSSVAVPLAVVKEYLLRKGAIVVRKSSKTTPTPGLLWLDENAARPCRYSTEEATMQIKPETTSDRRGRRILISFLHVEVMKRNNSWEL